MFYSRIGEYTKKDTKKAVKKKFDVDIPTYYLKINLNKQTFIQPF